MFFNDLLYNITITFIIYDQSAHIKKIKSSIRFKN